jgi:hypothetical protein
VSQKNRTQLKSIFAQGVIPSQQDFSDFIDSTWNISDDGSISGATGPAGAGSNIWTINGSTITPQSSYSTYTITGAAFNATSDYRIKENVQNLDISLYNVDKLRPVIYNQIDNGKINMGLIAHELQEYFPFLVEREKDGEQTQSVNYIGLIGLLIKEIHS